MFSKCLPRQQKRRAKQREELESFRVRYKSDPEQKLASVRDSYRADPGKKLVSTRESVMADPEKNASVCLLVTATEQILIKTERLFVTAT